MADTKRSLAEILTLFADNTTGNISAQDLRDMVVTLEPDRGEMHVTSASATTVSDTTSYFPAVGTYTLDSGDDWDMNTNGQLRYIGTPDRYCEITCSFSVTAASNNQVLHFALCKNGSLISASDTQRKVGTGGDVGSGGVHGATTVSTNDYICLAVRNETSATNVTFVTAEVYAKGIAV